MTATAAHSNIRPAPDPELVDIARSVVGCPITGAEAYETARHCLPDSLACALLALRYPACTELLGPPSRCRTSAFPSAARLY